ncbi:hypothetical protein SAMN02745121_08894 [Nannocystis exedens]|uniref:Uncharacterized protein n=1 Tax=Nannocystis exedens TaxID=54 RepID=A0A1I2IPX4_9BACT|nr:hypothetical protein [Nannocystis exedens]PCC69283.1 hypothetical protein NAEX_02305 [Nannocystis exedens]SFF44472.1 hypothetical protein SAMN02745121_08894 [Nannocystis exedens]
MPSANVCDPGLACLAPDLATECDPRAPGCCLPFCDIDLPNTCPGHARQAACQGPTSASPSADHSLPGITTKLNYSGIDVVSPIIVKDMEGKDVHAEALGERGRQLGPSGGDAAVGLASTTLRRRWRC